MRRRQLIGLIGALAASLPFPARALRSLPVIGFLGIQSLAQWSERLRTFKEGLRSTGIVEGENVTIEYRWAENRTDQTASLLRLIWLFAKSQ